MLPSGTRPVRSGRRPTPVLRGVSSGRNAASGSFCTTVAAVSGQSFANGCFSIGRAVMSGVSCSGGASLSRCLRMCSCASSLAERSEDGRIISLIPEGNGAAAIGRAAAILSVAILSQHTPDFGVFRQL